MSFLLIMHLQVPYINGSDPCIYKNYILSVYRKLQTHTSGLAHREVKLIET